MMLQALPKKRDQRQTKADNVVPAWKRVVMECRRVQPGVLVREQGPTIEAPKPAAPAPPRTGPWARPASALRVDVTRRQVNMIVVPKQSAQPRWARQSRPLIDPRPLIIGSIVNYRMQPIVAGGQPRVARTNARQRSVSLSTVRSSRLPRIPALAVEDPHAKGRSDQVKWATIDDGEGELEGAAKSHSEPQGGATKRARERRGGRRRQGRGSRGRRRGTCDAVSSENTMTPLLRDCFHKLFVEIQTLSSFAEALKRWVRFHVFTWIRLALGEEVVCDLDKMARQLISSFACCQVVTELDIAKTITLVRLGGVYYSSRFSEDSASAKYVHGLRRCVLQAE